MAYIERNILTDYPYFGTFYKTEIDKSLPLDKQVEEKIIIYETQCDITESSHSWSRNFIWAKYAVYFPYDIENDKINGRTKSHPVIAFFLVRVRSLPCFFLANERNGGILASCTRMGAERF